MLLRPYKGAVGIKVQILSTSANTDCMIARSVGSRTVHIKKHLALTQVPTKQTQHGVEKTGACGVQSGTPILRIIQFSAVCSFHINSLHAEW